MSAVDSLLAEAVEECPNCHGAGRHLDQEYKGFGGRILHPVCMACHGRGTVLTMAGVRLVESLRPFLAKGLADEDHTHTIS